MSLTPEQLARHKKLCSMPDCGDKHFAIGYCQKHYARVRNHGTPHLLRREAGEGSITDNGYLVHNSGKRRSLEHIIIAERALGKGLPDGAIVHHLNGDRLDNRSENLVICQDQAYHKLLHLRQAALDAGYAAHWRRCWICCQFGDPGDMVRNGRSYLHRPCLNVYIRPARAKRRVRNASR